MNDGPRRVEKIARPAQGIGDQQILPLGTGGVTRIHSHDGVVGEGAGDLGAGARQHRHMQPQSRAAQADDQRVQQGSTPFSARPFRNSHTGMISRANAT
ncbi:hypothetical protein [Streptomyces afghaniensis]|uniref:hypothetical protein n=1 Tax=Streptomyces afghaniensis TaxID=66865 RepID=UPI000684C277|nr:hypothetical protein [Streptomyces afghaniensis]